MESDTTQQPGVAQRLTRLATELAELAMTIADQEQRQRQRDQAIEQALAQLAELSASLHGLTGDQTPPPAAEQRGEMPVWQQMQAHQDAPRWS